MMDLAMSKFTTKISRMKMMKATGELHSSVQCRGVNAARGVSAARDVLTATCSYSLLHPP